MINYQSVVKEFKAKLTNYSFRIMFINYCVKQNEHVHFMGSINEINLPSQYLLLSTLNIS